MRALDHLIKKQGEKEKKKPNHIQMDEEDDMYMESPRSIPLNQNQGIFYQEDHSVNVDRSIFDQTAVFHTTKTK